MSEQLKLEILASPEVIQVFERYLKERGLNNTLSSISGFTELVASATRAETLIFLDEESITTSEKKELSEGLANWLSGTIICLIKKKTDSTERAAIIASGYFDILTLDDIDYSQVIIARAIREINTGLNIKELSLESELFSHMVENSRSMFTIINEEYRYIKVNDLFCKAHNVSSESVVGKTMPEVWGQERFTRYIKENIDTCFKGETITYQSHFDVPSSGKRHFEVVMRPVKSMQNSITHLLCETFDITDITIAARTALNLESDFKSLESNLPIGYVRTTLGGNIVHANKSLAGILGFENPAELENRNFIQFYADRELFDIHTERMLEAGVISYSKFHFITSAGKEIICRLSGFLTRGQSEDSFNFDFSIEDITRELDLEQRLNQSEKLETIGSLTGGIAHDFNNILGTVFGYSELILDETEHDSGVRGHIEKILSAVSRARSLISQMLAFSRQTGQERVQVSPGLVMAETIEFLLVARKNDLEVVFEKRGDDVTVLADPTQLFRVFLNILTNAANATEEVKGVVKVEISKLASHEVDLSCNAKRITPDFAIISIEDNGSGMEPSVVGRIFEPFFTTQSVSKGTGLGLSVVHGIIAELGGDIVVTSNPGEGSRFDIYLPEVSRIDTHDLKTDKPMNILLASDSGPEGSILKMALERIGHLPVVAHSSKGIRQLINGKGGKKPEIVIFIDDEKWQERGDVIAELRTRDIFSLPLIVIAEGDYLMAEENLLNLSEKCQHLLKPVSLKEVNVAIKSCLTNV